MYLKWICDVVEKYSADDTITITKRNGKLK